MQENGRELNPWVPMGEPIDLKHMGKLLEELGELTSAASRCLIQGIGAAEPVTKKPNREWLEEELADVSANMRLVIEHFGLDLNKMSDRAAYKYKRLKWWHDQLKCV